MFPSSHLTYLRANHNLLQVCSHNKHTYLSNINQVDHIANKVEMKLYIYRGLDNEQVPEDVTYAIFDNSVTFIKKKPLYYCRHLMSVIMGDNVKRIEKAAFYGCIALRFLRLSKALEYIGDYASRSCESLFLPSTLKEIGYRAFKSC